MNLKCINGLTLNNNALSDSNKISNFPATVKLNGYAFTISEDGSVDKVVWIDNNNGSYTNAETGQSITVGDRVKYEELLELNENTVDQTKLDNLKQHLRDYSGDSTSTVNSNIDRDNSLNWRILDIKDGSIRIISSTPTKKKIKLNGYDGYNNAVLLIDEACNTLYSSNVGISKNLKIEDIEEKIDKTVFDYTTYINTDTTPNIRYGESKQYESFLKFPKIYSSEVGCKAITSQDNKNNDLNLSEQLIPVTGTLTANNILKATQTHWKRAMTTNDFSNSKYYNLFIRNESNQEYAEYFLSSRCLRHGAAMAAYMVFKVTSSQIGATGDLYYPSEIETPNENVFRPVITLNSNVKLESDGTNTWKIK